MKKMHKRIISLVLSLVLLFVGIPLTASAAPAGNGSDPFIYDADPSSMDGWKNVFQIGNTISTENAGNVWMDKSVFLTNDSFKNLNSRVTENGVEVEKTIDLDKKDDSFLVALSAMASNMTVMGEATIPTETVLVLDISGSMDIDRNAVADDLIEAANSTIATLLGTNKQNRVGVIVYSSATTVMLPLGRYETGSDGEFLNYNISGNWLFGYSETVSLDADVVYEGTSDKPFNNRPAVSVEGATYIQRGVYEAVEEFLNQANPTAGSKPVIVLMSDGAPTRGSTDFTAPDSYNFGDGETATAALGFVTQLTLADARNKIEAKYGTDCLIYTLGVGVSGNSIAKSVLDPANSSTAINDFWSRYNDASVNETISVTGSRSVTKIQADLNQNYVDKYFEAEGDDLAAELKKAFQEIAGTIQLQSKYYPTLISGSDELSGYVSFVDRVGDYMQVIDVKGIMIHDTLFSGACLASNFVEGGGRLGSGSNATPLGHEMLEAVKARLGISDDDTARTLIFLAYEYGQISYTNHADFSNYIGWYANAAGEFLGFYHEGVTLLPEPTGNSDTDPAFVIRSYGYLGEVDAAHGVAESDMMYATVQVRKNIATGEELVTFAVPAALIPVVSYEVTLDENNALTELTTSGATSPIRLIYEVALDEQINIHNLTEKVSASYLAENIGANGEVYFYTNKWDHNNATGYGTVNTYGYFNPSRQNDKYYFLKDTPVYADQNGTLYSSATAPTGNKYSARTVYIKQGNTLKTETHYHIINSDVLSKAKKNTDNNNWYIPQGLVHIHTDEVYKGGTDNYVAANNPTETFRYTSMGFVDTSNHGVDDLGYEYYVGATLGNNGRISVPSSSGIKITKRLAEGVEATSQRFNFTVVNTSNPNDNSEYSAIIATANGTTATTVKFTAGRTTVALGADESIYIGGLTEGNVFTVTETETVEYALMGILVNGNAATSATLTVADGLQTAEFINAYRKVGNLTIAKEIEHDLGTDHQIPDMYFSVNVTLEGIGTENNSFTASMNGTETVVNTLNGTFRITLKHGDQFEIFGIPEGTVVTVTETNPGAGFEAAYWDNGVLGDGKVTIAGDATASVLIVNGYSPNGILSPSISVGGTKYVRNSDGTPVTNWGNNTFDVVLKRYTANGWTEVETITLSDYKKTFSFDLSREEYPKAGVYSYQVFEIEPPENSPSRVGGMLYDKVVHTFSVYVSDPDMDGMLDIVRVHSDHADKDFAEVGGTWMVTTDFTNVQHTTAPAPISIKIQKELSNPSASPAVGYAGYSFGLYTDAACTTPVSDAVDGVQKVELSPTDSIGNGFIDVIFDKTGNYTFYVKEIAGNNSKMTYSQKVVKVDVTVTNGQGGALVASVAYDTATNNEGKLEFTNVYAPERAELVVDFVSKQLVGRDFADSDSFTFNLVEVNLPAGVAPQTLNGSIAEDTDNDRITAVEFNGKLYFDKVGTYIFEVTETTADGRGITTDKTTHVVWVTVTDINGQLTASYRVTSAVGDEIVFVNTYDPTDATFKVEAQKILDGRALLNDEFTFILTEVLNSKGDELTNAASWEDKNAIDGKIEFPEIKKDTAGTYYYILTEVKGSSEYGIHYDETKYLVTVSVTDENLAGVLEATLSYSVLGETAAARPVFNNKYVPSAVSVDIVGNKTIIGAVLGGGDFDFELYASDENWALGNKLQTVQNNADGRIEFTALDYKNNNASEFKEAGEYYYLVKEVNGGSTIDRVTYDATVYRVKIIVTDNLLGELVSEIHVYDENDIPQESIVFVNTYTAPDDPNSPITGIKDNMSLWIALMAISAGGIITFMAKDRKKEEQA